MLRPAWGDAIRVHDELAAGDRSLLGVLGWLPLLPEKDLEALTGSSTATLYRVLNRLQANALVAALRMPVQAGNRTKLWYLADLGLAALALDLQVEPHDLARTRGLASRDLQASLPGLPHLLAGYRLLATLAAAVPGTAELHMWSEAWRGAGRWCSWRTRTSLRVPACATLAWKTGAGITRGTYLLVPDRATCPLRVYRSLLARLRNGSQPLPPLLIATTSTWRAEAWAMLLAEANRHRRAGPLTAQIVTWDDVREGLVLTLPVWRATVPAGPVLRPLRTRQPASLLPQPVRGIRSVEAHISPAEYELLSLLGHHPFMTVDEVALAQGWTHAWANRCLNELQTQGLIRQLARGETGTDQAGLRLLELTLPGLALVAAGQGMSLAATVRTSGLAGGGPETPAGMRGLLLRHLAHTRGVYSVVLSFASVARRLARTGRDHALVEWQTAVACRRSTIRPDAYCLYRYDGVPAGCFLEYDRGTMRARDYRRKFAAYHACLERRLYEHDYAGFPSILVVTTSAQCEERIAQAARAVQCGHTRPLPLLLTSAWRALDNTCNPDGLLGRIWRGIEQDGAIRPRRCWPPETDPAKIRLAPA